MFYRKVLLTALLAVVLLGSFMDGSVSVDARHRRRPRLKDAGTISMVDPTLQQASLTDKDRRRRHKVAIDPAGLNQVAVGTLGIDLTMWG